MIRKKRQLLRQFRHAVDLAQPFHEALLRLVVELVPERARRSHERPAEHRHFDTALVAVDELAPKIDMAESTPALIASGNRSLPGQKFAVGRAGEDAQSGRQKPSRPAAPLS